MTMYQGLDLSRFKKVSSDKKTSTLRHNQGHQITIAHGSLSPKMREHIESMPVHMAEGGDPVETDDDDDPSAAPDTEAPGNDDPSGGTAEAPAPTPDAPPPAPMAPAAPTPPSPADSPAPEAAPAAPAPSQSGNVVVVQGVRKTPAEIAQNMNNHDLEFQQDLAKGHIQPETYHSLYAKKDTLGKIGALFGMLISGAGSGLAHQSNALMDMMNKQIQNDFEAQKGSNENAQNWLRLGQAHELQKYQQENMSAQTEQTKGKTAQIPLENDLTRARIAGEKADADLKVTAATINRMKIAAVHDLGNTVDKIPPGPLKETATQVLGAVQSAVASDVASTNAKTADHLEARRALRGDDKIHDTGVDMKKFNALVNQGKAAESIGAAPRMSTAEAAQANKEASAVQENRAIWKMYQDSFQKLDKVALAGKINPQLRNAEIATLGAQIAKATAGRFTASEAAAQADGMFPSATDWGKARPEKLRKAEEYFKSEEAGTTTLDRYGLKTPFPSAKSSAEVRVGSDGKKYQKVVGGWIPMTGDTTIGAGKRK